MQTEQQAPLCVQKRQFGSHKLLISINTVYETVPCLLHTKGQQQGCTGRAYRHDYSHCWVRSSCSLFRVYACYEKKPNHAAEMCSSVHTRFIIGLPNI